MKRFTDWLRFLPERILVAALRKLGASVMLNMRVDGPNQLISAKNPEAYLSVQDSVFIQFGVRQSEHIVFGSMAPTLPELIAEAEVELDAFTGDIKPMPFTGNPA